MAPQQHHNALFALDRDAVRPRQWPARAALQARERGAACAGKPALGNGRYRYARDVAILTDFARQAGLADRRPVSPERGLVRRPYGALKLGGEPESMPALELRS